MYVVTPPPPTPYVSPGGGGAHTILERDACDLVCVHVVCLADEVTDALSKPLADSAYDDDALMDELNGLEQEMVRPSALSLPPSHPPSSL